MVTWRAADDVSLIARWKQSKFTQICSPSYKLGELVVCLGCFDQVGGQASAVQAGAAPSLLAREQRARPQHSATCK